MSDRSPQYAPFWSRVLAQNLDILVLLAPAYLLSWIVTNDLLFYILMLITYLVYHIAGELSAWKGSLGKKVLRIEVTGTKPDADPVKRILLRNSLKILSALLLFSGFLLAGFNRQRQTLHDKISGSVVIIPLQ